MSSSHYNYDIRGVGWTGGSYHEIRDPEDQDIDFFVDLEDGRQFSGNAVTVANAERVMFEYLKIDWASELYYHQVYAVILPRLTWEGLTEVIDDLVARGTIQDILCLCDPDDDEDAFDADEVPAERLEPQSAEAARDRAFLNPGEGGLPRDDLTQMVAAEISLQVGRPRELGGRGWTGVAFGDAENLENGDIDFVLFLDDGRNFHGTAVTPSNVRQQMAQCVETGKHSALYFPIVDTALVPQLTWDALTRVIDDVVARDEMYMFRRLDHEVIGIR